MHKALVSIFLGFLVVGIFYYYLNKPTRIMVGDNFRIEKSTKLDNVPMLEGVGQIGKNFHFRGWGYCRLERGGTLSVIKVRQYSVEVSYFNKSRQSDAIDPECLNKMHYSIDRDQYNKIKRENRKSFLGYWRARFVSNAPFLLQKF